MARWIIGWVVSFVACSSFDYEALQKRAEGGDPQAQFQLGLALDSGRDLPRNLTEAVQWYTSAAEQGYAEAQNSLGSLYQAGDGITQDYAAARSWYQRAADQGHATATRNLAYMYDLGLGVTEDNPYAAELYEKAAEGGDVAAMLNLGVMLRSGEEGVERDGVEAYKWLDLARFYTQFSNDMTLKWRTRGVLDEVKAELSPAQIEEAERRTTAWDQQHRRGKQ